MLLLAASIYVPKVASHSFSTYFEFGLSHSILIVVINWPTLPLFVELLTLDSLKTGFLGLGMESNWASPMKRTILKPEAPAESTGLKTFYAYHP